MDQVMTIEEIEKQFDREWVLIADPLTDEALEVKGGRVVYHSKDRDEFDRQSLAFQGKRFAVLFTGKPVEEMEFAL
jgi:hypothetical protein